MEPSTKPANPLVLKAAEILKKSPNLESSLLQAELKKKHDLTYKDPRNGETKDGIMPVLLYQARVLAGQAKRVKRGKSKKALAKAKEARQALANTPVANPNQAQIDLLKEMQNVLSMFIQGKIASLQADSSVRQLEAGEIFSRLDARKEESSYRRN